MEVAAWTISGSMAGAGVDGRRGRGEEEKGEIDDDCRGADSLYIAR